MPSKFKYMAEKKKKKIHGPQLPKNLPTAVGLAKLKQAMKETGSSEVYKVTQWLEYNTYVGQRTQLRINNLSNVISGIEYLKDLKE